MHMCMYTPTQTITHASSHALIHILHILTYSHTYIHTPSCILGKTELELCLKNNIRKLQSNPIIHRFYLGAHLGNKEGGMR